MIKVLKEYIRFLVLEAVSSSVPSMADIAEELNGSRELKYERKKTKEKTVGIRFNRNLDELKNMMASLGADTKIVKKAGPGQKYSLSGKYDTYLFTFPSGVRWPDGNVRDFIPIVVVDIASSDALSKAKLLGYGAEQAVFASLAGLDDSEMHDNIINDTRLNETIQNSPEDEVQEFLENCSRMLSSVSKKLSEKAISLTVEDVNTPPGGGSGAIDITAVDPIAEKNYNVHVKYQSDRLVGLPIPKFAKNVDKKTKEGILLSHPNVIYRRVRDEFAKKEKVMNIMAEKRTSDINAIFFDKRIRDSFYKTLFQEGFGLKINEILKSQLGFEKSGDVENSLYVNFSTPDTVTLQTITSLQGEKIQFEIVIPEEQEQKISRALTVTANVILGKNSKKILPNVLEIEFGAGGRSRGLDVHKGENYAEFLDELQSL